MGGELGREFGGAEAKGRGMAGIEADTEYMLALGIGEDGLYGGLGSGGCIGYG